MKNCKKILAMMLTLVMVISMCAFTVSADRINHEEPVAGTDRTIIIWDSEYWAESTDTITKGSKTLYFENSNPDKLISTSPFGLVGATLTGSSVSNIVDSKDANNKVLKVNANLLQCNFRAWFDDEKTDAMGDNNVLSFTSRMMVPSEQTGYPEGVAKTDITRRWTLPYQIKSYDGTTAYKDSTSRTSPTAFVKAQYNEAGQLVVSAKVESVDSKSVFDNPIVVPEDEYFTVNSEIYVEEGQKLCFLVYVNDELIYFAYNTVAFNRTLTTNDVTRNYSLGFDLMKFEQGIETVDSKGNFVITGYIEPTTILDETKISAHKIDTYPIYYVATTRQADPIEVAAKGNTSVLTNIGLYGKTIQQSTGTSVATTYSRDTETVPGETLININTSGKGLTRLIGNIREPFADVPFIDINATTPTYIVSSMDLYIPSGTESVEREFNFSNKSGVRGEGVTDDTLFKSDTTLYYVVVKGGKLNFKPSLSTDVVEKPFVTKAEEVTFPSDKLVNVKIVWEVTGTEAAGYDVKFYGIVDDELAYVSEYAYPAGEFGFSAFNLDVKNTSSKAVAIDTKVDNINIAAYTHYAIPEKTWNLVDYAYPAVVTVNGNTVNAKAMIVNSSTDKLDAVVAFYDVNGKLIAPLAKTTLTKSGNDFSIEANAEIPEGAVTSKVFFFDSLATAKPVMKSVKITIE